MSPKPRAGSHRAERILNASTPSSPKALRTDTVQVLATLPAGVFLTEADTHIIRYANPFMVRLIGRRFDGIVGKHCSEVMRCTKARRCPIADHDQEIDSSTCELVTVDGATIPIRKNVVPMQIDGTEYLLESFLDLTETMRAEDALSLDEDRLESALKLSLMTDRSEDEIFEFILEEGVRLTASRIGYILHLEEDESTVRTARWSRAVLEACATSLPAPFRLKDLGLLGECTRRRKPVTHNDYPSSPSRHALPEGHSPIERHLALPLFTRGKITAVLGVGNKPNPYDDTDVRQLSLFLESVSTILERRRSDEAFRASEERLETSLAKLREALNGTVWAIARAVEARDPYTAGHQRRVSDLARAIAGEMGLAQGMIEGIRLAGIIHDIGKISVPAEILAKPGRLSEAEFELVKMHSRAGSEMIEGNEFPWPLATIILQHHERLDGQGYPQGLRGDAICIEARVIAVADIVEAMASHRPYRASLGIEKALEAISEARGKACDADVVDACLRLFREKGYSLPVRS